MPQARLTISYDVYSDSGLITRYEREFTAPIDGFYQDQLENFLQAWKDGLYDPDRVEVGPFSKEDED